MTKTTLAVYKRENTLPKYCKSAFAFAQHIVEIECSFDDYSNERRQQTGNGDFCMKSYRYNPKTKTNEEIPVEELFPDLYTITVTNVRGVKTAHSFKTKKEANLAFIKIKSKFNDWSKEVKQ